MIEKKDNTYCSLPLKQILMIEIVNGMPEQYVPCMYTIKEINHCRINNLPRAFEWTKEDRFLTPEQVMNHKNYKNLVNDLKSGVKNSACNYCWKREENNEFSPRLNLEQIEKDTTEGLILHFNTGNSCNLRCRMCSPLTSNLMMKDFEYFKDNNMLQLTHHATSNFFQKERNCGNFYQSAQWKWTKNNQDKIGALIFAGGEPLFDEQLYMELNNFKKDINLKITTNGTLFTDKWCNLLKQFKNVYLEISIDSVDKNYEYIRYPMKFSRLEKSLNNLFFICDKLKHVRFNHVISVINALEIGNIILWSRQYGVKNSFAEVFPQTRGIGLRHLPKNILIQIINGIDETFPELIKLRNIFQEYYNNNYENKNKILLELNLFDKSRNQKYNDFLNANLVKWLDDH